MLRKVIGLLVLPLAFGMMPRVKAWVDTAPLTDIKYVDEHRAEKRTHFTAV